MTKKGALLWLVMRKSPILLGGSATATRKPPETKCVTNHQYPPYGGWYIGGCWLGAAFLDQSKTRRLGDERLSYM